MRKTAVLSSVAKPQEDFARSDIIPATRKTNSAQAEQERSALPSGKSSIRRLAANVKKGRETAAFETADKAWALQVVRQELETLNT